MNKICTTIEQSQKLIELGININTADMYHAPDADAIIAVPYITKTENETLIPAYKGAIPAWSLAALLDVLPKSTDIVKEEADTENEQYMCTVGIKNAIISTFGKNPVDACYEMIIKLHDQGLL